jgi:acetyl-CoA hydrolase
MTQLADRIHCPALMAKVVPVEEAVKHVKHGDVIGISGFTKSGDPKVFMPALAKHLAAHAPDTRLTLLSGASLAEEVENPIAPFLAFRGPYMSSSVSRKLIHSGKMNFFDQHLSIFARGMMYGFYGDIDVAVVEVSSIRSDGAIILSSSVGVSVEALARAKKIVLEVNTAQPDFTGYHDIVPPATHPHVGWPIPVVNVDDRVGTPYVQIDLSKVVAVVESNIPDYPVPFKPTGPTDVKIGQQVMQFLYDCQKRFGWGERIPPIQSGVGNVANAIVGELYNSTFERMRFWTEVFQDGMLRFVENEDKFERASATAISFSKNARSEFDRLFKHIRDRLVLRPMWMSNSPELITRLFVIAMNTPIEFDIYGHVNSTHVDGSRIINGLGGSGDFLRNAYISIVHSPSVRKLKDGRVVSCVMPHVWHIDHTEHDIKCFATEQGFAPTFQLLSARHRALEIIDSCAHPHFRSLLKEYLRIAGEGDAPRPNDLDKLKGWWTEYDAATRSFPDADKVGTE